MDSGLQQKNIRYPVSFTGSGGEFFKIWIINVFLTIVTLYIYSAWAKVRTKRYFYGNTVLDQSSFEYHARPLQILLSRLVAAVLLVLTVAGGAINPLVPPIVTIIILLVIPWAVWRSTKFNMRMTSYRNVRFGFDGGLGRMYLYQFLLPLLVYLPLILAGAAWVSGIVNLVVSGALAVVSLIVSLVLAAWSHRLLSSYFVHHYLYGKSRFSGQLSTTRFVSIYACVLAAIVAMLVVFALLMYLAVVPDNFDIRTWIEQIAEQERSGSMQSGIAVALVIFYLLLLFASFLIAAIVRAGVRQHVYANTVLDGRVSFESTATALGLFWVMFSNFLLTVLSVGLATPFAKVRMANYLATHSFVYAEESLDAFVGQKREEVGALGDELGDAFDMDMDVGF